MSVQPAVAVSVEGSERCQQALQQFAPEQPAFPIALPLRFTPRQQAGIARHPQVRVAINSSYLPVAFIDNNENLRGVAVDPLTFSGLHTGMQFVGQCNNSPEKMLQMLSAGDVNIAGALMPDSSKGLDDSPPWSRSDYTLLTQRALQIPLALAALQKKQWATVKTRPVNSGIVLHYPNITLITKGKVADAVRRLVAGSVDDYLPNRRLMRQPLHYPGHQISEAADGNTGGASRLNRAEICQPAVPPAITSLVALQQNRKNLTGGYPESNAQLLAGLPESTQKKSELLNPCKVKHIVVRLTERSHKTKKAASSIDTGKVMAACGQPEASCRESGIPT